MIGYLLCLMIGATVGVLMTAIGCAAGMADEIAESDRLYRDRMEALLADEWELREAAERVEKGAA